MIKRQQGFTLIELIMVIVILGVLAAFAVPRFADLGGDARRSTIQGVEASMKSASMIAHAAFLASGTGTGTGTVTMEGKTVAIVNGYPSVDGIVEAANITGGANATDAGDFIVTKVARTTVAGTTTVQAKGATTGAQCQVVYTEAASGGVPTITSTLTGC